MAVERCYSHPCQQKVVSPGLTTCREGLLWCRHWFREQWEFLSNLKKERNRLVRVHSGPVRTVIDFLKGYKFAGLGPIIDQGGGLVYFESYYFFCG